MTKQRITQERKTLTKSGSCRLNTIHDDLDHLHSAICEGDWEALAELDDASKLIGWLRDIGYLAKECIRELENVRAEKKSALRVVHKAAGPTAEAKAE